METGKWNCCATFWYWAKVHIQRILYTTIFWFSFMHLFWILLAPNCANFNCNALQQNSGLEVSKTNIYPPPPPPPPADARCTAVTISTSYEMLFLKYFWYFWFRFSWKKSECAVQVQSFEVFTAAPILQWVLMMLLLMLLLLLLLWCSTNVIYCPAVWSISRIGFKLCDWTMWAW